jgi:perosamine synthetase
MTLKYPISQPSITSLEIEYVMLAARSGWISSIGDYVDKFEEHIAQFVGTRYAVSTSNGTTALHLALLACGIKPGDEVIVPDLSFIATANAVLMCGARPVFVDVEAGNLCIDPSKIEERISNKTKAIIPVHLYGHPADMTQISEIARRRNLLVIEDAAEAHGASILGVGRVGGLGHCAAFSFYGNKILTTGEGGAVTTNDFNIAETCRRLRDHSMSKEKRYFHNELGYNYRMTNLQAAIGCAQFERSDDLIKERLKVCSMYNDILSDMPNLIVNRASSWAEPVRWLMCLEIPGVDEPFRNKLIERLRAAGVDSRPYFYPMSSMPYFETASTPVAHCASREGLNLPTYVGMTADDVALICGVFLEELAELIELHR